MKTLIAVVLLLAGAVTALAQPDPRDSIILESKTVAPGAHPGSGTDTAANVYLKVYITNKDSLVSWTLALVERSTSGGAYMTLGRPRNVNGVLSILTNTLRYVYVTNFTRYNSASPDSFTLTGLFDPMDPATIEPPNLARKLFREIKFDSVFNSPGTIELDTATVISQTGFTNTVPADLPVHFVKSVVTVGVKGDLNGDGSLSAADAVMMKNCVFLGEAPPGGSGLCDLNCDGMSSAADVVVELNAVFLGDPFPC